jgi:thioredoxin-like negative regulator of GroEL
MRSILLVSVVLLAAAIVGFISQKNSGKFRAEKKAQPAVLSSEIANELGAQATLLQFSSAFCAPCRATRLTLENIVPNYSGIKHIEIDAESHLELVRKLDIRQTPTTVFLDRNGVEIGRAVGAPKKSQVIAVLEKI